LKCKKGLAISLLLVFSLMLITPAGMATTAPIKYSRTISHSGENFKVTINFNLFITCSDNWLYFPGVTSDTLTAKLELNDYKLEVRGKTCNFNNCIGETGKFVYKQVKWTKLVYQPPGLFEEEGSWITQRWVKNYYIEFKGKAIGSIVHSENIASVSPETLTWEYNHTETAQIITKPAFFGSASIKVRVDQYLLHFRISSKTFVDGQLYSSDPGKWSGEISMGSTPSEYAEITMTNIGVPLFIVALSGTGVAVAIVLFVIKREVGIVALIKEKISRLLISHEEKKINSTRLAVNSEADLLSNIRIKRQSEKISTEIRKEEVAVVKTVEEKRCAFCGEKLQKIDTTKYCPWCGTGIPQCITCLLPIIQGDDFVKCPYCGSFAHRSHLVEWVKIKGSCPYCKERLTEFDSST